MKRFISILLTVLLLSSLSAAAFADGGDKVIMDLIPDVKEYHYEDGTPVPYAERDDILKQFHYLRHGVGIYWGQLESAQLTFEQDADGEWKAVSQQVVLKNGRKLVSSDPNVVFIDRDNEMHPTGAGEATVTVYDSEGNEITTYKISVTGRSFSSYVLVNECPQCHNDQSNAIHYMSCGHYSCDVGRAGHGDAPCGYAGHFACDGSDHSICFNCLKPVCKGEHGRNVCPHVHSPVHAGWDRVPTCTTGGVERIVCSVCGFGAIVQTPPQHTWHSYYTNICVYCHAIRDEW